MGFSKRSFHTALTTCLAFAVVILLMRSSLCPILPQTPSLSPAAHKDVKTEAMEEVDKTGFGQERVSVERDVPSRKDDTADLADMDNVSDSNATRAGEANVDSKEELKEGDVERNDTLKAEKLEEEQQGYPGGEDPKNVWIVSNRRSGTHMTMDVIAQVVEGPLRVFKTNHVTADTDDGSLNCECLAWLQANGRIVHAYRDVRDVVIAMYYYNLKFNKKYKKLSVKQYLAGKDGLRDAIVRDWVRTTGSWFKRPGVLNLNYDETVTGMPYVYDKIAKFLSSSVKNWKLDPRKMKMVSGVVHQGAGKGSGGWKRFMSTKVSDQILKLAKQTAAERKNDFLKCEDYHEKRIWDMSDSFEIAGNSKLRAPSVCPKEFFGHSSWIITPKKGNEYETRNGKRKVKR